MNCIHTIVFMEGQGSVFTTGYPDRIGSPGRENEGGLFVNIQSNNGRSDDEYHALERQLWTIDGEEIGKGSYTREKPFFNNEIPGSTGRKWIHLHLREGDSGRLSHRQLRSYGYRKETDPVLHFQVLSSKEL